MIPNSDNTTPLPITRQPDWSRGVKLTLIAQTEIFISRAGKEQRSRKRRTPKARIEYQTTGLTLAEAQAAMTEAEGELQRLCIVPFWSEGTQAVTNLASNQITIGVDPRRDFFAVGQYAFLDDGTVQDFRLITAVSGRILTFEADAGAPPFSTGAWVYPCRKCRRMANEQALEADDTTSHTLTLAYESTE